MSCFVPLENSLGQVGEGWDLKKSFFHQNMSFKRSLFVGATFKRKTVVDSNPRPRILGLEVFLTSTRMALSVSFSDTAFAKFFG